MCGKVFRFFWGKYRLARHIAFECRWKLARWPFSESLCQGIYCWCNLLIFSGYPGSSVIEQLAHHLAEHGGAVAHYLECKLGVD